MNSFAFMATDENGVSVRGDAIVIVGQVDPFFDPRSSLLRLSDQGFQVGLDGAVPGRPIVIHASLDLIDWQPVFTNTSVMGATQFLDAAATNMTRRFYRAVQSD